MPWLTPNDETGAAVCRPLFIPPAFLTTITGALEELAVYYNWEQWGDLTPQQCADTMRAMLDTFYEGCVPTMTNNRARLTMLDAQKVSGGADVIAATGNQWLDVSMGDAVNPAVGDEWRWAISLKAGTYKAIAISIRGGTYADTVEWKVNGTVITTFSVRGTFTLNYLINLPDIVLTDDADITVGFRVAAGNGTVFGLSELSIFPASQ